VPHEFEISTQLTVVSVVGLVPPQRNPQAHVLRWTSDGRRKPAYFRWSWHPPTGDMVVGVVQHHIDQIPKDETKPFTSWLRGFVFCAERQIAVRSYYWPVDLYDDWDAAHAKIDKQVAEAFFTIVRPHVRGFSFRHPIDNRWLLQTYGRYSSRW